MTSRASRRDGSARALCLLPPRLDAPALRQSIWSVPEAAMDPRGSGGSRALVGSRDGLEPGAASGPGRPVLCSRDTEAHHGRLSHRRPRLRGATMYAGQSPWSENQTVPCRRRLRQGTATSGGAPLGQAPFSLLARRCAPGLAAPFSSRGGGGIGHSHARHPGRASSRRYGYGLGANQPSGS